MPATTGNDTLSGTSAAETLDGLAGNDTLVGGAGNDTLLGGSGVDTAVFNAAYSNYTLLRNPNGSLAVSTSLASGDGTDQLLSVENLKFSDALVTPLMAGVAAEFKVNTAAAGGGARVAKLSDGGWVVIWSSGTSTATATLYGQRFDTSGAKVGAEFAVNPARVGNYDYGHFHSISGLSDGGWIINWVGIDSGRDYGIFGQRFTSGGVATGVFSVTANQLLNQIESSVTGLSDGGWLSVWSNRVSDGSYDIAMRRFSAVGITSPSDITVNTFKPGYQEKPFVAALSNGGWVVAWQSTGQDAVNDMGVYGQAYKADGTALGKEFRANTTTYNSQSRPAVAGLADGGWVVVWQSYGQAQDSMDGVYAQRFDAAGLPSGAEFRVNSYAVNSQRYPSVSALKDGGWVVVWESEGQDGSFAGIYGQRYGSNGAALGGEFKVNDTTDNAQMQPSVSALEDGGWVVSWLSSSAVTGKSGVLYQRYGADGAAFASAYSLSVTGDATSQNFVGTAWADTLSGMAGNDTLNGGSSADVMIGGAGNDVFIVDQAGDSVVELAGEGTDTIISTIDYSLPENFESLTLVDGSAVAVTGNTLNNVINGNTNNNTHDGGAGADIMAGGFGDDVYRIDSTGDVVNEVSAAGNDLVISSVIYTLSSNVESITLTGTANLSATGNALDNTLTGNAGIDTLTGGTGNDTYVISHSSTVIVEGLSAGTDVVRSTVSYRLPDNVENLVLLESASVTGTGNALSNAISGNSQSNMLDGGAGIDTLSGGAGDDVFIVDHTSDVVRESAGEGTDEVRSSVSYSLLSAVPSAVEVLTLTGQGSLVGSGNELDNTLTGNDGIDTLLGATGNDVYVVNNTADRVLENANSGTDEVRSSVSYTITDNVERLVLTGGDGIVGYGNSGDNTIVSSGGVHTLAGGLGNDTYFVNNSADVVVELQNGWTGDQVVSTVDYGLSDYVENLRLEGFTAISGTGNALANIIEGNAVANRLLGGGGNDSIDGRLGADTLIGGTGDDQYYIDDVNDLVVESFEEGIDAVSAYITHVLSGNVENLQLSGSNAINGGGNALANQITGNDGANSLSGGDGNDTLNGGAGIDTLVGGAGDDLYLVSESSDVISETQDAGIDTVRTLVSYCLASNIENLTITSGADSVDGIGNSLANIIVGGSGANVLFGAEGDDTLSGNAGNDVLVGGSGTDVAIFAGRMSDYSITQDYSTGGVAYKVTDLRVTSAATGVDLVAGVEHLKFTDASVQLVKTATGVLLSDLSIGIPGTSLVLQQAPSIAALSDGGSVAVWMSSVGDGDMRGCTLIWFGSERIGTVIC